jgi:Fe-S cluster assembly iron-binding protein IscA
LDIMVTGAAAEKAKEFLRGSGRVDEKGNLLCGLRLYSKGSDVLGVKYVFSVDCNAPRQNDKVIESYGFKLYVDSDTYAYLSEITESLRIDHVESPEYSGFRVSFPEKTITLVGKGRPISQPSGVRLRSSLAAVLFIIVLAMGLTAGWLGGSMSLAPKILTSTQTTATPTAKIVNLDVIPDWGGPTYDAFVISSYANGTAPRLATNTTGPGPNNNNITVHAGVSVTFVITSIDTAVNQNFTGPASTDFTIYNDTASGQVASHYSKGQSVSSLPVGHTFTIPTLKINIPIPPDTIVTFTYTFSNSGVYAYLCEAPCGPGMGLTGYMVGYVIVTAS